jgi:threonine/homoserine/homoserine lactone efflux protein
MDVHLLLLFYATQISLAITPGPDWLYVMSRGVAGGRRSALVSVGGICSGYLADSVLVALGLAALLQSSDAAFEIVRYGGAAYLIYLGARMILSKGMGLRPCADADEGGDGEPAGAVVFRQGFLTAVLNPKGLLLFLSLLPQFVTPSAAFPVGVQLLVLGVVHTVNCAIVYGAVGIGAGRLGEILKRRLGLARVIRWLAGSVLIALGLRLVFPGKR